MSATCHIINLPDYFINLTPCSCCVEVVNDEFMLGMILDNIQLILSLSNSTEKSALFKNVLYCKEVFYNLFSINQAVLNDVEFKIIKRNIDFTDENSDLIDFADCKHCHFSLQIKQIISTTSTDLAFVTTRIDADLEDAKSSEIVNDKTDQQNSDNIIDQFNQLAGQINQSNH